MPTICETCVSAKDRRWPARHQVKNSVGHAIRYFLWWTRSLPYLLAIFSTVEATHAQSPIPRTFFGMHIDKPATTPWPPFPVGSFRTWDSGAIWKFINTAPGVYDWRQLDRVVGQASAHDADVLITLGGTPSWAATDPTDKCGGAITLFCSPPSKLTHWTSWVTAVVNHIRSAWPNVAVSYEVWNEPNNIQYWNGTLPQLVTLTRLAYQTIKSIDPTLTVACGSVNGYPQFAADGFSWAIEFFRRGGGSYCDVWAIHAYPNFYLTDPVPAEQVSLTVQRFSTILRAYGYPAMPVWNTESSWGAKSWLSQSSSRSAYILKMSSLLHASGVVRSYWYTYDGGGACPPDCWGQLWGEIGTTLTPEGKAYKLMIDWLLGSTPTSPVKRQPNVNGVRNAAASLASTGIMPTHWSASSNDVNHGIVQTVTAKSGYIDWRVHGKATAGASGFEQIAFEDNATIKCSGLGEQWWIDFQTTLVAGSYKNVSTYLQIAEFNSSQNYLGTNSSFFTATPLEYTSQNVTWFASTANEACAFVQPIVGVKYQSDNEFDITIRLAEPSLDNGTTFIGEYTRPDGSKAILGWDDNSAGSNFSVQPSYKEYQDVTGRRHEISGAVAPLTSSPIFILQR
jgi:hypothetical protein